MITNNGKRNRKAEKKEDETILKEKEGQRENEQDRVRERNEIKRKNSGRKSQTEHEKRDQRGTDSAPGNFELAQPFFNICANVMNFFSEIYLKIKLCAPLVFIHFDVPTKFESQNLRKIKFLHSYFIFVTYLPREVDGRVNGEAYFLDEN